MKGILLPHNYVKFPLVKFIVSKIAYESLENTKNERFLTMDHRNVVLENFFSDIGGVLLVRNLFRPIRVINRTTSQPIWTPTCEDIGHIAKNTSSGPPEKKIPISRKIHLSQSQTSNAGGSQRHMFLYLFSLLNVMKSPF